MGPSLSIAHSDSLPLKLSIIYIKVLQPYKNSGLTGIFHSFTGTPGEAVRMMEFPDLRSV